MAFTQRRKMLRGSLKSLNLNFDELKIAPESRPEELSIEDFCKIANFISK
jgi:16S rRNA A1518/A1519 N6-dimethyltransferase RsmA/KsgA/DIM1 with predicted DNA glycosylase/AP lyase activity